MKLTEQQKEKLENEFIQLWDSKKESLGLGKYSSDLTQWWLQKIDTILKNKNKEIVEMIEKGVEEQVPIGCPDNHIGCLVYHSKTVRRDLTSEELINKLNNK